MKHDTIPVLGFKTANQVSEAAKALDLGVFSAGEMKEIKSIVDSWFNDIILSSYQPSIKKLEINLLPNYNLVPVEKYQ